MQDDDPIRALLDRSRRGDRAAREELFTRLYDDLRALAGRHLRGEPRGHTLAPTSLLHETWVRLRRDRLDCAAREEFLRLASAVMRRVLIDGARRRIARCAALAAHAQLAAAAPRADPRRDRALLAMGEALEVLRTVDPELHRVASLRFLLGLDVEETAAELGVSAPTVKRRWRVARAWLRDAIERRVRGADPRHPVPSGEPAATAATAADEEEVTR